MRTTLNIDDTLIKEIMDSSGIKSKTEIIHNALKEYRGKLVRENIKNACGKLHFDIDVRALRNLELQENL
ncbi:MAG: type II toxin-antitoxin system VapB family antitoxin [bacterium]|nr:type II toxin-antitoxin system VapB family antitoxin [bacterium]